MQYHESIDNHGRRVAEAPKPHIVCKCGRKLLTGTVTQHYREMHRGVFKEEVRDIIEPLKPRSMEVPDVKS